MIREACVAGRFYENNVKLLREIIEDSFNCKMGPGSIPKLSLVKKGESIGAIMVPHAGGKAGICFQRRGMDDSYWKS